ncbi:MAG: hypothetical protein AB7F86_02585 [Bdellovibrionales bacterium]
MDSLGLTDKNNCELFAGDTVQIVNGANAGKTLYKIRASAKSYTIEGSLSPEADASPSIQISCKKVMRVRSPA